MPTSGYAARPSDELERVLNHVERLRPFPANLARLLRALDHAYVDTTMIAELLSFDPALTAYILKAANTPRQGSGSPCSSLLEAVERLGLQQVRVLALSSYATGPLARRLNGYRLGSDGLWQHSLSVAVLSRWLAQALAYPYPDEAYTAGLLHDLGKLLLDQYVLVDYDHIIEFMWKRKMPLWQVEKLLYGLDHATVGSMIATRWGFPLPLIDSIRCHHLPSLAHYQPRLAAMVHIANAFSPQESLGLSALSARHVHPDALRLLNLELPALEQLRTRMLQHLHSQIPDVHQPADCAGARLE